MSTSPDSPSRRCEGAVCRALAAACSMKSRQPGLFEACSNRPETGRRQARPAGTHRCTHARTRTHTLTHARARRFGQEQGWWLGQATRSLAAQAAEPGYLDRRVAATADARGPRSRRRGVEPAGGGKARDARGAAEEATGRASSGPGRMVPQTVPGPARWRRGRGKAGDHPPPSRRRGAPGAALVGGGAWGRASPARRGAAVERREAAGGGERVESCSRSSARGQGGACPASLTVERREPHVRRRG